MIGIRDEILRYDEEEDALEDHIFHDEVINRRFPTIRTRLEFAMMRAGMNQYQLSKASGVSRSLINMILNDHPKHQRMRKDTAVKLCKGLGIRVNPDFLTGESDSFEPPIRISNDTRTVEEKQRDDLKFIICHDILPKCGVNLSGYNHTVGETLFRLAYLQGYNESQTIELSIDGHLRDVYLAEYQRLIDDLYDNACFLISRFVKNIKQGDIDFQIGDFSIK